MLPGDTATMIDIPGSNDADLLDMEMPVLQVNLGTRFSRGDAAHIEFHLLSPGHKIARPSVRVTPPPTLDGDLIERRPQLSTEEPGHWSFTQSFVLARGGSPCPPGLYEMRLDVEFESPRGFIGSLPRFVWARIPFRVTDSNTGRELVVDLDECAILDGAIPIDPGQFGKVTVKGRGNAIASLDPVKAGQRISESQRFQVELKPNLDLIHLEPPRVSERFPRRHCQDSAALVFEGGRRILLLARKEVKLGRQRKTNDVVLRFLPPSDRLNELSLRISQQHVTMELTESGLCLKNDGRFGTAVNRKVTDLAVLRINDYAEEPIDLRVGSDTVQVEEPLELQLQLFRWEQGAGPGPSGNPDVWYFDAVGERPSATYHIAQAAGIDALKIRRKNNLPQEEYAVVFRQALIGPSQRYPIDVPESAKARLLYMGRCFWLENLAECERCLNCQRENPVRNKFCEGCGEKLAGSVQVQGESVPARELVPLTPGMVLQFGRTFARFEDFLQLHL